MQYHVTVTRPRTTEEAVRVAGSIGWDVGEASRKQAGRNEWSREDYNCAAQATNLLLAEFGLPTE